jgi:hypothetical protein
LYEREEVKTCISSGREVLLAAGKKGVVGRQAIFETNEGKDLIKKNKKAPPFLRARAD